MSSIQLPNPAGALARYTPIGSPVPVVRPAAAFNRVVFSAAHVVADPFAEADPSAGGAIDWGSTLAYRRHLADLGLGIAEAMDTAQRGMGLSWADSLLLIRRTRDELAGSGVRSSTAAAPITSTRPRFARSTTW